MGSDEFRGTPCSRFGALLEPVVVGVTRAGSGHDPMIRSLGRRDKEEMLPGFVPRATGAGDPGPSRPGWTLGSGRTRVAVAPPGSPRGPINIARWLSISGRGPGPAPLRGPDGGSQGWGSAPPYFTKPCENRGSRIESQFETCSFASTTTCWKLSSPAQHGPRVHARGPRLFRSVA